MASKRQRRKQRRLKQASKDYDSKETGSKKETARTDNNNNTEGKEVAKQKQQQPKEVFDSSKYEAMSDMTKGATTGGLHDKEAITDLQSKERLNPGEISNDSITTTQTTATLDNPPAQTINPMIVEERARTIREAHEDVKQSQSAPPPQATDRSVQESREDAKATEEEREGYGYNFMANWIEAMARYPFFAANAMFILPRQYVEMMNAGMEMYSQFMKGAMDAMEPWFRPFQRTWFGSTD